MKLTTRTRYGLRLLFQLALNYDKGTVQLNEIAKKENISEKYLEQIASFLKSAGFITAQRGAQGGYQLANNPSSISLADVVSRLEGSLSVIDCLNGGECDKTGNCPAQNVWRKLDDAIKSSLMKVNLSEMVDDYRKICSEPSFEI
ncbi:MAG: Rrf2 family transcriptional regulator [Brevinematales bacterium]|jgi:Rrf2 family protein